MNSGPATRNGTWSSEPVVVVAGVAVAGRQEHEPVVGLVGGPVLRVRMVEVVADVGRDRARRDDHVREVAVPGRRVVEARLPRVHEHRQRAPAGPPAAVEVVVLGDEPRVEPARGRRSTPRRRVACRCISRAARAWTGGCVMPDVSTSRGACAERRDDCQNAGPGKYASSPTDGLNTMCGTRPSAHWAPEQRPQLLLRPRLV